MSDEYAGYRKWWDPYWREDPSLDTSKWTDWDYALLRAYQIIEDYTDKGNGQLVWIDQSPDVDWEARSSFSGYDQRVDMEHRRREELQPGESIYAVPVLRNPDDPPSMRKWLEDLENDAARPTEANMPKGARPPTPEELAALREAGKLG